MVDDLLDSAPQNVRTPPLQDDNSYSLHYYFKGGTPVGLGHISPGATTEGVGVG